MWKKTPDTLFYEHCPLAKGGGGVNVQRPDRTQTYVSQIYDEYLIYDIDTPFPRHIVL